MWYFLLTIPAAIILLLGFGNKSKAALKTEDENQPISKGVNDTVKPYTREEIQKKLEVLANTNVPDDSISFGAMCYAIAFVRDMDHVTYQCPKCGSRTIYSNKVDAYYKVRSLIPQCREQIQDIKGINLQLEESQFCKKCSDVKTPELGLVVSYVDDSIKTLTYGIGFEDIQLINEFLHGRITHTTSNDGRYPLRDHLQRLEELLGIKTKE
jgi:DNA-directed RNA polymerase subunit RPC12/RpoP